MDLKRAFSEAKSLPDQALLKELKSPSGMMPGYIALAELNERRSLRSSASQPRPSIASEIETKGYAKGGMVAAINPFHAYTQGMKYQKALSKERPPEAAGQALPGLSELQAPAGLETLIPLQPGTPIRPKSFAKGGYVNSNMARYIIDMSARMGVSPSDMATIISYETGGTFNPTKSGPTTQWGQHRGLIQFGEPQAKQYGVDWNNPVESQLGPNGAVERYMRGAGVKPGIGMMDLYSAVNAGSVGRYGASDANNGGAPGTVADKVNYQMAGHYTNADRLLSLAGQQQAAAQGAFQQAAAQTAANTAANTAMATEAARSAAAASAAQQTTSMLPTMEAASPFGGLMSLMMMAAASQPAPAAGGGGGKPSPFTHNTDPKLVTEETSMTPNVYRRRRQRA